MQGKLAEVAGRLLRRKDRDTRPASRDQSASFDFGSIFRGHHKITYRGVRTLKCPFDYVIYQMLLCALLPDLVIEIGTNDGGGAFYLADLMETIGHGTVHTIDIKKQSDDLLWSHPRIRLFIEGWENYDLKEAAGHERVLVIEDASHIYEDTLQAMRKFAPVVSVGSYLIVEDGIISELGMADEYHGGPLKAIDEFLGSTDGFEIDRSFCDMFGSNATFNVNGYLKRVS